MRPRVRLFGISVIIAMALAHAAHASGQDDPLPANDVPGVRSPGLATTLSLLGTVVPIGLAGSGALGRGGWAPAAVSLGGWLLGPLPGYVYAGDTNRGLKGVGLRALAIGATAGAVAAICTAGCEWNLFGSTDADDDGLAPAAIVALGGIIATTVLTVRDIVRVDDHVRARNDRIARTAVSVGFSYVPEAQAPGVVLTLRR